MTFLDWISNPSNISIVTLIFTLIVFILESRRDKTHLGADMLLRLEERFTGSDFKAIRRKAAAKLLRHEYPNYELRELLDFFAIVVFLYEKRAIDKDLTFDNFSFWMIRYWLRSSEFVELDRQKDPLNWKTLEKITKGFMAKEKEYGYPPYSDDLLQSFLEEEARVVMVEEKSDGPASEESQNIPEYDPV